MIEDHAPIRLRAETIPLDDLIDQVRRGAIRIPSFQRLFRWNERDVLALFDSVAKGYPIGTLLLWQRSAEAEHVKLGPLEVDAPPMSDAHWVVDGQQRLTSLAGVLLAPDDVEDHRFRVFYDLRDGKLRRRGAQPAPGHWLPLNAVLDTQRLLGWLRDYPEEASSPEHVERALALSKRVREYRVPTYVVEGTDEEALRDVFQRVNRGGKPLRAAEVFDALHGHRGDSEPTSLRALGDTLAGTGFGELDQATLLRSLLASRGGDAFRDFEEEFASRDEAVAGFRDAEHALRLTITFLQEQCGFPLARVVPYAMVIPTLTRFFAVHPKPHPRSRELLRRWVWRGAIVGIQPDGFTSALRRAVKSIDEDEHASVQRLVGLVPPLIGREPDLHAPRLNTAAGRLAFNTLWSLNPESLSGDGIVDPAQAAEDGMLIITGRAPTELGLVDRLLHPSLEQGDTANALLEAPEHVLRSHAIDQDALTALRRGDEPGFLVARESELRRLFDRLWQEKAVMHDSDRPPIDALLTDDE